MFVAEFSAGLLRGSTASLADSLDMFADAAVPASAVRPRRGGTPRVDGERAGTRLHGVGRSCGLIANVTCLVIISKHRRGEVHMRASWIFSTNDVIANLGVIIGGALVYYLDNRFPDLIIGFIVGFIVLRGGIEIMKEAREINAEDRAPATSKEEA